MPAKCPRIIVRSARIHDRLPILRMDIRRVFGANVRRYRLAARLSQEAVAVRMGVDRAHVSAIERGLQNATLLTILQAAHAECASRQLLEDNEPKVKGS